ncbi:MAG: DUF4124 domain-containing protein [Steroidobacteraceae bacterium]
MRRPVHLSCLLVLALAAPLASAQNMYQWKDASGVTHYSDTPPAGRELEGSRINARDSQARGTAPQTAAPQAESPQCAQAKLNQGILRNSAPVQQLGEDGKPGKALSPEERTSQLALADAAAKAYCKPAAAGH